VSTLKAGTSDVDIANAAWFAVEIILSELTGLLASMDLKVFVAPPATPCKSAIAA
jgi:hypothetical protein